MNAPTQNQFDFITNIKKLLLIFAVFSTASYIWISLIPSYLGFKASEAISTISGDSWCNPLNEGFGNHCFSDFYQVLNLTKLNNPWFSTQNAYPPAALMVFKFFSFLHDNFPNSRFALLAYFVFCITLLIIPIQSMLKHKQVNHFHKVIIFIIIFTMSPLIMAFDRGNIIIILIPMMFMFTISYFEGNSHRMYIFGVLMFLLKPQIFLLGILFIKKNQIFNLMKWTVFTSVSFLLSFLFFPRNLLQNINSYFGVISNYQSYTNAGSLNPVNISISNTILVLKRILLTLFPSSFGGDPFGKWNYYPVYINFIILVLSSFFIYFSKNLILNIFIAICNVILLPNVSFAYYLCLLIPIFVILFIEMLSLNSNSKFIEFEDKESQNDFYFINNTIIFRILSRVIICTLFVNWAVPWSIIPNFNSYWWSNIGINWLVGQIVLVVTYFVVLLYGINQFIRVKK